MTCDQLILCSCELHEKIRILKAALFEIYKTCNCDVSEGCDCSITTKLLAKNALKQVSESKKEEPVIFQSSEGPIEIIPDPALAPDDWRIQTEPRSNRWDDMGAELEDSIDNK